MLRFVIVIALSALVAAVADSQNAVADSISTRKNAVSTTTAAITEAHSPASADIPFDQHIAHRAVYHSEPSVADWERLPFNAPLPPFTKQSVLHVTFGGKLSEKSEDETNDNETQCFIALSGNILYASKQRSASNSGNSNSNSRGSKLSLESPYFPWHQLHALDTPGSMIIESRDERFDFYVLTDNNILGLRLRSSSSSSVDSKGYLNTNTATSVAAADALCGAVIAQELIIREEHRWQQPLSISVSSEFLWVATRREGVLQVQLSTGDVVAVAALAHLSTVSAAAVVVEEVTAMVFVPQWQRLLVGTRIALYTLQWDDNSSNKSGDSSNISSSSSGSSGSDSITRTSLRFESPPQQQQQQQQPQLRVQYREWVSGVLGSPVRDFAFDSSNDCLWLAEHNAVHKMQRNGQLWRYGYHQGLPMGNITSVAVVPITRNSGSSSGSSGSSGGSCSNNNGGSQVWVGSRFGVARFNTAAVSAAQDDTLQPGTSATTDVAITLDGTATATHTVSIAAATAAVVVQEPWEWLYFAGNRHLPSDETFALVGALVQTASITNDATAATTASKDNKDCTDTTTTTTTTTTAECKRSDDSVVLAVTATGLSLLESAQWTLREKAAAYAQFQYPRHDRRKLTTDCGLHSYGDTRSFFKKVGDNDGLWTAMHAMGEAYSYAVTKQQQSRTAAWRALEALELLNNVTGAYPMFPARSYCFIADGDEGCGTADGAERWHLSKTVPGAMWKDDTSSDEIDGHLAALPLLYDLVAQSPAERKRVLSLLSGITGGIVANDLFLIDPSTGKRTTWGIWNPRVLNDDPKHYSERGPNSVAILAYLASAYSVTRETLYKQQFEELVRDHGYVENSFNAKIDAADDDNHSDNELLSLSYHILFYSWHRIDKEQEPEFKAEMWHMVSLLLPSADRTWQLIGAEFSPLWAGIYIGMLPPHTLNSNSGNSGSSSYELTAARSVWSLRRWSLDLIAWPVDQSRRWDQQQQPFLARDGSSAILRDIRPPQERVSAHWNADPFRVQDGSGFTEYEPAIWRLPYFLMRYYGMLL